MEHREVYLDNSATTAMHPDVLEAMLPYFKEEYGNASTIYNLGQRAKNAVDMARESVAKSIGANKDEVFFTGSGSEGDNWAIKGAAFKNRAKGNHIISSKIEHHAVLHTLEYLEKQGFEVTYLDVDEYGVVNPQDVEKAIKDTTILITIMYANNEIGTIEPIEEIAKIAKEHKILMHTDAVQAVGSIPVDVKELGVDMLTLSAHKFYGPKGVGALYIRRGLMIDSLLHGGQQERGRRAATENVAGIVGLAKALEIATEHMDETRARITTYRDWLIERIEKEIPYVKLNGHPQNRLPGNVNFSFRYIEGESLLLWLSLNGIAASSGSACTSGSLDPSHVLLSIGLPHEIAHGSLRISIGANNTMEDLQYLMDKLVDIVSKLRAMSPLFEEE